LADVKLIRELFLEGLPIEEIATKFERDPLEIAHALRHADTSELRCSFCNRGQQELLLLIAGALACICDVCLDTALQFVKEERPELLQIGVGALRISSPDRIQHGMNRTLRPRVGNQRAITFRQYRLSDIENVTDHRD